MTTLIPKFKQSGTGAINQPISLKLAELISVKDFGAVGDGTTDDTAAIQATITAHGSAFFPSGTYLVTAPLILPEEDFYVNTTGHIISGQNATILYTTTTPLFTCSTGFASKWNFSFLTYKTTTANAKLFNMDTLYNCNFTNSVFYGISTTYIFYSTVYIQSAYISNNHFTGVGAVIRAIRAYNLNFTENFLEACVGGIFIDGSGDPAANMLRINNNVIEGGGQPIQIGGIFGGSISGNYFESNTLGSPTCDINLGVTASFHKGLSLISNMFIPSAGQIADVAYSNIKFNGNTIAEGFGPAIIANTTTAPNLVLGAVSQSLVVSNYSTPTDVLVNNWPVPQQNAVALSGFGQGFVNNRASAYNGGTTTWSVINVASDGIYEIDGSFELSNIGGNILGVSQFSVKFWVWTDSAGVTTAGIINPLVLAELAGTGSVGAYYTAYWGAGVAATLSVTGTTTTLKFDAFSDYSYPSYGVIYSLRPLVSGKLMNGTGYQPIGFTLP